MPEIKWELKSVVCDDIVAAPVKSAPLNSVTRTILSPSISNDTYLVQGNQDPCIKPELSKRCNLSKEMDYKNSLTSIGRPQGNLSVLSYFIRIK